MCGFPEYTTIRPLHEIGIYQDNNKSFNVRTANVSYSSDGTSFKSLRKMKLDMSP